MAYIEGSRASVPGTNLLLHQKNVAQTNVKRKIAVIKKGAKTLTALGIKKQFFATGKNKSVPETKIICTLLLKLITFMRFLCNIIHMFIAESFLKSFCLLWRLLF